MRKSLLIRPVVFRGDYKASEKELKSVTKKDRKKVAELEKELARKEKALAEAAALLVLRKKYNALFNEDPEDDR